MGTRLADRKLPNYTKGEELFNMISHIVGAAMGLVVLIICVAVSAYQRDIFAVIGSIIYGLSMILLYTMSSIYHGLTHVMSKKVFQVLDHCAIYFLIAGTYSAVALGAMIDVSPFWAWTILIAQWGLAAIAIAFTAIDLKKYQVFAMICYILMGWMIILLYPLVIRALTWQGFLYMLVGGIFYTIGAVLYGIGKRQKYMHNVFHIFVLIGSFIQFLGIVMYAIQ